MDSFVLGAQNLVTEMNGRVRYPGVLPHLMLKQIYYMAVFFPLVYFKQPSNWGIIPVL